MTKELKTRAQVYKLVRELYKARKSRKKFIPGKTRVRYSGGFFGAAESNAMIEAIFDNWLGLGVKGEKFEEKLAKFIGSKKSLLTNSGSSSSLLAMSALTSRLRPDPLKPGDEVITPACTFSTTVSAIVKQGLVPKFVDSEIETLNPKFESIADAVTRRVKAIFILHNLGNPNQMDKIMKLAKRFNLYVIEDNCDGLGSKYLGKQTGSFGHMATQSFYPAHHITTGGEGGAVVINDMDFYRIVLTLRNWGRGCWCLPSEKHPLGACKARFRYTLEGNIPIDHRYLFTEMGYNLKPVEMQAAMGLVQLRRFPSMMRKRQKNFETLYEFFKDYQDYFYLPKSVKGANPCWFTFPLTLKPKVPFTRNEILSYLAQHEIEGRSLFAGNIIRQPAMRGVEHKVHKSLKNSDYILKNTFFVGIWPGLGSRELSYMKSVFKKLLKKY